jgi:RHH-type proline utilization regulon transcriptional repressor/proline dehydrogenase/delta 1-pyrroline-5-carboxylate dehydrogenase
MREEFGVPHDRFKLLGQDNFRRYRPVAQLRLRLHAEDTFFDVWARIGAARLAGCRPTVSAPPEWSEERWALLEDWTAGWGAAIEFVEEDDDGLGEAIRQGQTDRIRFAEASRVPEGVRRVAAETGLYLAAAPVLAEGRVELLWYMQEQSVSFDYHRYGNLAGRSAKLE